MKTIKEKYDLLTRFGLINEPFDYFRKRVLMRAEYDEAYQDGCWDLANELAFYLQDENRFDELNDLLYNFIKY